MGSSIGQSQAPELLFYRPWRGTFRPPIASVWPIARTALGLMLRRWFFWVLYALGLLDFLMFFFGQNLLAYANSLATDQETPGQMRPRDLIIRFVKMLDGSGLTYSVFLSNQGYIITVVLALAGALLIGNDLRFGSLPFYLAKPVSRYHYLLGKAVAVAVFINLMTTLPALVLFIEFVLLFPEEFFNRLPLVPGILGYCAVMTVSLSLILLGTAIAVRKTVPLIMVWTTLFLFFRLVQSALVDQFHLSPRWRLIDLWNNIVLIGNVCLGLKNAQNQPDWSLAALVLGGVSLLCLSYLILRIRAVEIVT
jgi:ABC-2 type transport system permease protein